MLTNLRGSFVKQEKWQRKRGENSGFSKFEVEDEVCATGETKRREFWIWNKNEILIWLFVWVLSFE